MKKLLYIVGLFISVSVNAQTSDTVYVESLTEMDTAIVVNDVIEKSDIVLPYGHYISITGCKLETLNPTTVKVVFEFDHLEYGEIWLYDVGYIQELKEPWDLGCDNLTNSIELISCSYRSFEISDSILKTLHNEVLLDLQNDSERMKGMIEGPNDSTYIKYYETTVKTIEEYKKSMDLFYEYRDRMINVMTLQYNEGRMVGYYESSFGTQINVKQIEILRLLKGE